MEGNRLQLLIDILNYKLLYFPIYKIALAFFILFVFLFLRKAFTLFIINYFHKLTEKTETEIDDKILSAIKNPLRFLFVIIGIYLFLEILNINIELTKHITKALLIFTLFWVIYNIVDEFTEYFYNILGKFGKTSIELASFLVKILKILIISIAIIALLQDWGINITGFIASLGLGGLAFALAAKDTAANIFGGIAILTDNIFKIGEWVKVNNAEGIVEDIGIRTTKIRAFDKRLIIVPNANIANSNVENFSRRKKRRVSMKIGIKYNTSTEDIKKIVDNLRKMLHNHKRVAKDETILVYFDEFDNSSLNIFCYFFINTAVWSEYLEIKEDINLKIKEIIEDRTEFAFPSNSVYIETPILLKD